MAYNYILLNEQNHLIDGESDLIYGIKSASGPNGGNDVINGLGGDDRIYAKFGNDIIDGGRGNDLLDGGWGNDTFYFGRNSGYDVITGLGHEPGNRDKIVVEGNYNGYYVSPITGEVVLKLDHNENGTTDARVLLAGVYESEWLSLQNSVIIDDPSANGARIAARELHNWDIASASFTHWDL